MNKKIYIISLFTVLFAIASCDDYLDVDPDTRTTLDSKEKIKKILVSAYPTRSSAVVLEMASDNADYNTDVYSRHSELQEQAFWWRETYSLETNDNTKAVWDNYYSSIAAVNHALQAIEELEKTGEDFSAQKGEALMCRALNHFLLVTTFSKMYGKNSSSDMGIPYATEVENTVIPAYERGTVADAYKKISEDIEAGINLLDDNAYSVPKYHFTQRAAYAFAARFYLYYQKYDEAIAYATKALGPNPIEVLRDWESEGLLSQNGDVRPNAYVEANNKANLMLNISMSSWVVVHANYSSGARYSHNSTIANNENTGAAGPWGGASSFHYLTASYSFPKVVMRKYKSYFQYTDPVAGIGYSHWLFPIFTTDETLLNRAEAYALSGKYDLALNDINIFLDKAYKVDVTLTKESIDSFYDNIEYYNPLEPTPKKKLNPDFTIPEGSENLMHAILQLKRRITLHEGLRWHDINRYRIIISRRQVDPNQGNAITVLDELTTDDNRRAIQLPTDVTSAGLPANPR